MAHEEVITIVKDLLGAAGISYVSVTSARDHELDLTIIAVETHEHGLFVYRDGELMKALRHLVRRILEQKLQDRDELPSYILDVNNEHTKYLANLKDGVRGAIQRAQEHGVEVELEPMTAYERLIVHSFVGHYPELVTRSVGEGSSRRVVLVPRSPTSNAS